MRVRETPLRALVSTSATDFRTDHGSSTKRRRPWSCCFRSQTFLVRPSTSMTVVLNLVRPSVGKSSLLHFSFLTAALSERSRTGGQIVNYENGLSFLTVHGSGHMVPQFQPQAADQLLKEVLRGGPFAPALPTDEEIAKFTDEDFEKEIDAWTNSAREYVQ